jgi:Xaa-Pro aminopeptidase
MALEPGMVLALEPKVILPGKGVLGIENTWMVTETGLERLTRFPDAVCMV